MNSPLDGLNILGLTVLGVNVADIGTVTLLVIMTTMGLELQPVNFRQVWERPLPIALGLLCQVVLGPLVAFALAWALHPPLPVAAGLILLACCPSAATSAFFTFLARGDVAISVTLTALSGPITTITLPLLVNLGLDVFGGQRQAIHLPLWDTMRQIATLVVLPVLVGMTVRALAPRAAARIGAVAAKVSFLFVIAIMVILLVYLWERIPSLLAIAGGPTLALNLSMLLGGFIVAKLARTSEAQSRAIGIEIGIHNFILAVVLSLTTLHRPDFAIVPLVYLFVMYLTVFLFIAYCRLVRDRRPLVTVEA